MWIEIGFLAAAVVVGVHGARETVPAQAQTRAGQSADSITHDLTNGVFRLDGSDRATCSE
jgi:hypothetical protein